jgi:tetratricopeptide (TPR) repeat protein
MMKKRLLSLSLSITTALLSLTILTGAVTAGPSFQQGIADYKAGRYQQALNTFKTFAASYPNNALVHYYLAMSHQAVGHIAQAKQEYQAAILYGDAGLKQQATTGLNQLSKANTQIAYSAPSASAPSAGGGRVSPGGSSQPKSKVRKIYEFYADW